MRRLLLRRKACRLTQPCVQLNEQNGLLGMAAALRQRVGKADGGLIEVGDRLTQLLAQLRHIQETHLVRFSMQNRWRRRLR